MKTLKNLKKILQQRATRWMIIKDAEEWLEGFEKEFQDLYLLLRDAFNQLQRGENMDMEKLGSSIRVAFKKAKEILGDDE